MPSRYYPRRYASKRYRKFSLSTQRGIQRMAYAPRNFGTTYPNALYATTMPAQMKVAMKYNTHYSVTSGAGTATDRVFKLNSIFDPDHTGTGHQPLGRDQWALLYSHYRVDKVKVFLTLATATGGGFVTLFPSMEPAAITDPVVGQETRNSITKGIQAGSESQYIRKSYNVCDIVGTTRQRYSNDDIFQSAMTTDPSLLGYIHVSCVDNSVAAGSIFYWSLELTYYCTLYQPIQVTSS